MSHVHSISNLQTHLEQQTRSQCFVIMVVMQRRCVQRSPVAVVRDVLGGLRCPGAAPRVAAVLVSGVGVLAGLSGCGGVVWLTLRMRRFLNIELKASLD